LQRNASAILSSITSNECNKAFISQRPYRKHQKHRRTESIGVYSFWIHRRTELAILPQLIGVPITVFFPNDDSRPILF
jgi:hypothetical protein